MCDSNKMGAFHWRQNQAGFLLIEALLASVLGLGFAVLVWQMVVHAGREQHVLLQTAYATQLVHAIQLETTIDQKLARADAALPVAKTLLPGASWQLDCQAGSCHVGLVWEHGKLQVE